MYRQIKNPQFSAFDSQSLQVAAGFLLT